jgi:cytochrome P450
LQQLREESPVHWSEELRAWLVTRHAHVCEGLSSPYISANRVIPRFEALEPHDKEVLRPLFELLSMWPLMRDRPDHQRFRRIINRAMTRAEVARFTQVIRDIATDLVERGVARGGMDAISELAYPLPLYVVSDMLGAPRSTIDVLKECASAIVTFFGAPPTRYAETARHAHQAVEAAAALLGDVLGARRERPADDLISKLARSHEEHFDDGEILATCIMMVFAGFETTTNLLGNGLMLLLEFPEQLALLRRRPELMRSAIGEMLRYEPPVQRLSRMALDDFELGGRTIHRGELVFFMAAAANRDPRVFPDPDRFDITRDSGRHLAFGTWIHTCPGATLAQLEAEIVFGELLRRAPEIHDLRPQLRDWQDNLSVRALRSLPVRFS